MYPLKIVGGIALLIILAWACSNLPASDSAQQAVVVSDPPGNVRQPPPTPSPMGSDFTRFWMLKFHSNSFGEYIQGLTEAEMQTWGQVEHRAYCHRVVIARDATQEFIVELTRLLETGQVMESDIGSIRYDAGDFNVWLPDAQENLTWLDRLYAGCVELGLLP